MPRAGTQKVKTGCKTCKARKVKCDETWPKCKRCTTTGRTCDGYRAPPAGSFSWDVLLRAAQPRLIPVTNAHEVRSLSYFHHAVAPILSGPFDSSFWTYFVAQMTHSEPAARHAVLAISSLYEGFEPSCTNEPRVDRFAIAHYNKAISLLVNDPKPSIDNVLLVCVLFICIEFLRGNREAAISHASHGVRLLNAVGHNSRLSTTFSQMSIFPLFFVKEGVDFPLLQRNGSTDEKSPIFFSMSEAQHALDHLCIRTLRLIRAGTPYRFETAQGTPPQEMYDARRHAMKDLEAWGEAFEKFQATRSAADRQDTSSLALKTRQKLTKIWCSECLEKGEMGYDALKSDFVKIVGYARKAAENLKARRMTPAKFMFDTGFNPMLHFIVKKCRFLRLRLEALHLLRTLASERESLWDASLMYDVSRRIIEVEHDIDMSGDFDPDDETMPPDEKRVRGFFFQEGEETPLWDTSAETVYLVVSNPEGGVMFKEDFLKRNGDFHCQEKIHRHSLW